MPLRTKVRLYGLTVRTADGPVPGADVNMKIRSGGLAPFSVRVYPFKSANSVGERLGTGLDLSLYI
jgi:hypothetical protein